MHRSWTPAAQQAAPYPCSLPAGGFGSPQPTSPIDDFASAAGSLPAGHGNSTAVALDIASKDGASPASSTPKEGADVAVERAYVQRLWEHWQGQPESAAPAAILLHELRKVYPAADGNKVKVAVDGLSLEIQRCECFGLLGPNGAGAKQGPPPGVRLSHMMFAPACSHRC